MTPDTIQLEVVTPERAVLTEEVDGVLLPAVEGELGVLPGHVPMLTQLDIGGMVVLKNGEERHFMVERGIAEIFGDRVRVLAEDCEGIEDIDVEQARADMREAEEEIAKLESEGEEDVEDLTEKYRESLKKNRTRLMVTGEMDDE